jgi:hypothetical protein
MKKLFPLACVLLFVSACSYVYVPNAAHIPLISKKGDVSATVLTGTSNFDFQTAYGLTDQLALMLNGSFSNRTRTTDSSAFHRHSLVEAAAGYYKKIGRSGVLEVYGGGGYGSTFNYEQDNSYLFWGESSGKYAKFFIQPNIGATSDIFDGGLSFRLCYVNYFDYMYYNDPWPAQHSLFVEPVLTGKIGYKNVKFIMQLGFSFPVMMSSDVVTFEPFILNVGLNFKINTIRSKSILKSE